MQKLITSTMGAIGNTPIGRRLFWTAVVVGTGVTSISLFLSEPFIEPLFGYSPRIIVLTASVHGIAAAALACCYLLRERFALLLCSLVFAALVFTCPMYRFHRNAVTIPMTNSTSTTASVVLFRADRVFRQVRLTIPPATMTNYSTAPNIRKETCPVALGAWGLAATSTVAQLRACRLVLETKQVRIEVDPDLQTHEGVRRTN